MSDLGIGTLRDRGHKVRPRRVRGCLAVLVALAILVGIGVFAYVKGVSAIKGWLSGPADYHGQGHGSVIVQVKSGDTSSVIGATLLQAGVVKSVSAFTDAAKSDSRSLSIQVGYYRMRLQMSGANALKLMLDPSSLVSKQLTIPEGLRAQEILSTIAAHTPFSAAQVKAAFNDTKALGLPSYANGDAEGYLYPATYPVTPASKPLALLTAMTKRFKQEANMLKLTLGASALHTSPTDIVIIASLVQAEARRPQDMPKVARVIYNRLKAQMPLQFDSTLHYAIDSRGVIQTSRALRNLKTPYNSYTRLGLPPTAIDSPGEVALKAALHPAQGSWRYFVTVNLRTGDTRFASTFKQQLENEQLYHRYCQTSSAC
ncbi:MAG: hypothetical protein QOI06_471 [Nocardioidaceae bacterium]|nr:hypothetical protein [Nocardioidaceae bacterium]